MFVFTILVFLLALGAAYGVAYWAFRARHDRSANVGLYLLFGIPGILLAIAGLAFTVAGQDDGPLLLVIGLGLSIPLARPVRKIVSTYTPMDPASPVDMAGLCVILSGIGLLGVLFLRAPEPEEGVTAVGLADLVIQVLFFFGLAYATVGVGFHRSVKDATKRLGIEWPTLRTISIAVGFTFLAFLINGIAGILTEVVQPDVAEKIDQVTEDLTADVQNPLGAVVLGLSAGIGEEILLRGAVQPRFGILLTSTFFALLHVQYGLAFVLVGLFLTGVMLGVERRYFGTTTAIMTHALFNTIVVLAQSAA
ncbi:MAG: lysostaphin resistance A-like protein [Thermomicrobiales bacterium]